MGRCPHRPDYINNIIIKRNKKMDEIELAKQNFNNIEYFLEKVSENPLIIEWADENIRICI